MSKRLLVLMSILVAVSMLLAACGAGGGGAKTLKIVSSLPMTGSSLTQTQTIVNAEQLRLAQANNQACGGKYTISYEAWDDASAAQGQWDPAVETENGNKAAADPSIIAYLGTFNSGAAKLSIPILDQAGPLVMISPANTYPGLTKPRLCPGRAGYLLSFRRPQLRTRRYRRRCPGQSRRQLHVQLSSASRPFTSWTTSSCMARALRMCSRRPPRNSA